MKARHVLYFEASDWDQLLIAAADARMTVSALVRSKMHVITSAPSEMRRPDIDPPGIAAPLARPYSKAVQTGRGKGAASND